MTDIQTNTNKLLSFVSQKFESDDLDNESLVQLIELCGMYLNLQTIPNYAKSNNITYNGAKKCRNVREIIGVKFVIDND
jgi:hypothetical protein